MQAAHPLGSHIRRDTPATTGRPAVDFRLRDAAGRAHRLSDYLGSWLLLVFHRHLR